MTGWKLQVVEIDCPIKHWNHPVVIEMFIKIINLKLAGFHSRKPDNYLPINTSDFIGTHVVICTKNEDGSLHPIMGFKGITLKCCLHYGQSFTGRSCIASAQSDTHNQALDQYIKSLEDKSRLAYVSSFAIDPNLKGRKKLEAMKLLFPLLLFYYRKFDLSRLICLGSITSTTHITFEKLGFHPLLNSSGEAMPRISLPALQNEEVEVMTLEKFSVECEASATANQKLWDERIEISDRLTQPIVAIA